MTAMTLIGGRIPAMPAKAIEQVRALETITEQCPQVDIQTEHVFHAGTYTRTIMVPAGVVLTGALIEVDTVLIVSGDADVFTGTGMTRLTGYHVIQASAGRKQVFVAHTDTHITMIFPTDAKTVAEAEDQFTHEADRLLSRRQPASQQGEAPCLEQ